MLRPQTHSWVGLGLLGLGAVLCVGSLPSPAPAVSPASPELALPPGQPVRRELWGGESDVYRLPLASGEVVDVQIEQDGVDVSLILASPDGEELLAVDTPKSTRGTERLFDLAEAGGIYRLWVQASGGKDRRGSYILRMAKPRLAGAQDRMRARAWREYSRGEGLRRVGSAEEKRGALVNYGEAARLWQFLEDREQAAIALYRSASILPDLGDEPGATKALERALLLVDDAELRLSILNSLTYFYTLRGDTQRAFQTGEQALELAPKSNKPALQAGALNNLGMVYRRLGENEMALEYFDRALEKWPQVGANTDWARTLCNQAEIFVAIGNPKPVPGMIKEALRVLKEAGHPGGVGDAYRLLGVARKQLGSPQIALRYLNLSREQARSAGSLWDEELALNEKGSILLQLGELEQARTAFAEAGEVARRSNHPDNEAYSLSGLGRVLLTQGDMAGAIERFSRSQQLYERLGDPNSLAQVLYGRAMAERGQGRIEVALTYIDRALKLVEDLRGEVDQRDLRSHVIGARTDLYDLRVDLLLRLHERKPGQGFAEQAFAASEWRRARSLLDLVRMMGVELPADLPKESLRRQGVLRLRLLRLAQEKLKLASGSQAQSKRRGLPDVEREIEETLAQWEDLSEDLRRQSPAYAATNLPKLVGVQEVQKLLDADTALIAYTVGEEHSIVWWIERDALEVYQDLPSRVELSPLADSLYDLLSKRPQTRQRGQVEDRLETLGKILLGPLGNRLKRVRRIAVVADETLQSLPFAALPVPGSGKLLIEQHAVVQLPSASLAAELRARQQGRPSPSQIMAGFGDPVFGPSDERFPQEGRRPRSTVDRRSELPRLRNSRLEVKAIQKLIPPERSRWFTGFAATRRAAMDSGLADYRYIHFAAHGFVDPDNPSLSGIQLTKIDPKGEPLEGGGLLPFYEVYNLSFPADLVTLSACRTVDGPRVRGEGPLGMSRSFLYAGASRVIGTLWNVDDRDAADLMTLFYQFLLRDAKSPAVALQEAQKAMSARASTRAPYHWAGFVLQGDWR